MTDARCQVCGSVEPAWTIRQAAFDVGQLQSYKIQACRACTEALENVLVEALARLVPRVESA